MKIKFKNEAELKQIADKLTNAGMKCVGCLDWMYKGFVVDSMGSFTAVPPTSSIAMGSKIVTFAKFIKD